MMSPREFEEHIADLFANQSYKVTLTSYSADYGVDLFAENKDEKIAIQAKMYGNSTRKVNRKCVMELYGAARFFDCTKAIIATNGQILDDAAIVANKLGIEILKISSVDKLKTLTTAGVDRSFESVWRRYIMPLESKRLFRSDGSFNTIVKVDWSSLQRTSSKGNQGKIAIEIFKEAYNILIDNGVVTRDYINQNYVGRASSGVLLVLSQVPFIELLDKPSRLIINPEMIPPTND